MALPGHRRTSSDKRRRASHFALKPIAITKCDNCGAHRLPHHVCNACGFYRGRKVISSRASLAHTH